MFKSSALILFISFCFVQGQVPFIGNCPKVNVQQNFNVTNYLGKWYETERFFVLFELHGKCINAEYSLNDDGTVKVHNTQIQDSTGDLHVIDGSARFAGDSTEGKLVVNFPNKTVFSVDAPYWILETDYENYSVVWSCNQLSVVNAQFAWILTRDANPSAEILAKAHNVFDVNNLDRSALIKTDRTGC